MPDLPRRPYVHVMYSPQRTLHVGDAHGHTLCGQWFRVNLLDAVPLRACEDCLKRFHRELMKDGQFIRYYSIVKKVNQFGHPAKLTKAESNCFDI